MRSSFGWSRAESRWDGTILVIWTSCSDIPAVGFMPAIMPLGFWGKAAMLKETVSLPRSCVEPSLELSRRRVTFAEKDGGPGRHVRAAFHGSNSKCSATLEINIETVCYTLMERFEQPSVIISIVVIYNSM